MPFWGRRFLDAGVVCHQAAFNGVFVLEGSGTSAKASLGKPFAGPRMFGGTLNDRVTNSFGLVVRPDKSPRPHACAFERCQLVHTAFSLDTLAILRVDGRRSCCAVCPA